ncbi:MAG: cytochrome P450 [Deltaproteobacteria bacterium]|nr:cytochrome P450 [Deltaproteobacteria bacterium]
MRDAAPRRRASGYVQYERFRAPAPSGALTREQRDALLLALAEESCERVLAHNRAQALVLSLDERRARLDREGFAWAAEFLCKTEGMSPAQGKLPDAAALEARGGSLLRPELAWLLGLAKLHLQRALLAAPSWELPAFAQHLYDEYFPARLARAHPRALARERSPLGARGGDEGAAEAAGGAESCCGSKSLVRGRRRRSPCASSFPEGAPHMRHEACVLDSLIVLHSRCMKLLLDIDVLSSSGPPHDVYAEVRAREPVSWQKMPGVGGYWAVMKHADVLAVSRQPEIYSAQAKGMQLADFTDQLPTLLSLDPPRHTEIHKRVLYSFAPRVVRKLEPRIRSVMRATFERVAELRECDFVMDVARPLPLAIVCDLLGISEADRERVGEWADLLAGAADPEIAQGRDTGTQSAFAFGAYAFQLAQSGAEGARDSLLRVLKDAQLDGEQVDLPTFAGLFVQIAIADNETTRSTLAGGMLELMQRPAEYARLEANRALAESAVEEFLRWLAPVHYFRRTATRDTELRDVKIRAGDRVVMMYASANRDEDVLAAPQRFDVARDPNPHVSFGFGEHFCLGAALGRLEARVFLEEFFARFAKYELAGEPARMRSNELNTWKRMPVRLTPR